MKLVVVEEGTRSKLEFRGRVVRIGRAIDNDIRLSGPLTSRHHCRIEVDASGAWVIDLGSANGTQVNGKKVERQAVRLGDVVGVGGARIHIEELMRSPKSAGETQRVDPEAVAEQDEEDLGEIGLETMHGAEKRDRDNVRANLATYLWVIHCGRRVPRPWPEDCAEHGRSRGARRACRLQEGQLHGLSQMARRWRRRLRRAGSVAAQK